MKTQQAKLQRIRNFGASTCVLLSLAMVALLAGLGSNEAQAEPTEGGSMIMPTAEYTYEPTGWWYATVIESGPVSRPGIDSVWVIAGSGALSTSGCVDLKSYGYDEHEGLACIDETSIPALLSAGAITQSPDTNEDNIIWRQLYKAVKVPDPPAKAETKDDSKPETKLPETERMPDGSSADNPPSTSDVPQNKTTPAPADANTSIPQEANGIEEAPDQTEPEIFSLRCRESEIETKISELEAQGYEIVRVEKIPKWWRQR